MSQLDDCPSSKDTVLSESVVVNTYVAIEEGGTSIPVTIKAKALSGGGLGRVSFRAKKREDGVGIEYVGSEWRPIWVARETVGYVQAVIKYANEHLQVIDGTVHQKVKDDVAAVISE